MRRAAHQLGPECQDSNQRCALLLVCPMDVNFVWAKAPTCSFLFSTIVDPRGAGVSRKNCKRIVDRHVHLQSVDPFRTVELTLKLRRPCGQQELSPALPLCKHLVPTSTPNGDWVASNPLRKRRGWFLALGPGSPTNELSPRTTPTYSNSCVPTKTISAFANAATGGHRQRQKALYEAEVVEGEQGLPSSWPRQRTPRHPLLFLRRSQGFRQGSSERDALRSAPFVQTPGGAQGVGTSFGPPRFDIHPQDPAPKRACRREDFIPHFDEEMQEWMEDRHKDLQAALVAGQLPEVARVSHILTQAAQEWQQMIVDQSTKVANSVR